MCYLQGVVWISLPLLLFGGFSLGAGLLVLTLPETSKVDLSENERETKERKEQSEMLAA